MHILICEHEHFIRRALAEHLSSLGYQVTEVTTGPECLEFVTHTLPDLMLLDNAQIIRKLKAKNIQIPIIMMTSAQIPGYEYIQKPYELSDVSALIQGLISNG